MKKIFLFALSALLIIGGVFAFGALSTCILGGLSLAVVIPFSTDMNMDVYLKSIKDDTKLSDAEKSFATELFKSIGEAMKSKADSKTTLENLNNLTTELEKLKKFEGYEEKAVKLQSQIDEMVKQIDVLKSTGNQTKESTNPIHQIAKGLKDLLATKRKNNSSSVEATIELKAAAIDMGLTTAITGQIPQAEREAGINYAPEQPLSLLNVITTGTTNANVLEWVEKENLDGTPAFKKEFEEAPLRSWKSSVKSTPVVKAVVMSEYSEEIVNDVDYFEAEVRRDLVYQLQRVLETGVYEGNGVDPELKGILEYAQTWNNGTVKLATGVTANIYDVITWAITQIGNEYHNANVVMMGNTLFRQMKWTKDKNDNYIIPPFVSNGQTIEGIRVIVSNLIDDNALLVMDSTKVNLFFKNNIELKVYDQHADNASHGILMTRAMLRVALRIKNTDAKAFVYCDDVAAAMTSLEQAGS